MYSEFRFGRARHATSVLLPLACWFAANRASAYVPTDPWSVTAAGTVATTGRPIELSWSLAPDGTNIPGEGASNLIGYLDGLFNVSGTSSDFCQRPWFSLLEDSFDRWNEIGGITFNYEPNDNGSQLNSATGIHGVRGDVRLDGAYVDGPSSTLAYTWLPDSGDIVVDTGETTNFVSSAQNYLFLRNTVMHEIGHALGLLHVQSESSALLMEPYIDTSFEGPQLDDIRGLHGLYGDMYERTFSGQGNETAAHATDLGSLATNSSLAIGSDADITGQAIAASKTDFVSITDDKDDDFFSFTTSSAGLLDVYLTPLGGVLTQGVEGGIQSSFDANSRNNLSLTVYAENGSTLLGEASSQAKGLAESLSALSLPAAGTYYVRVSGDTDAVQMYELGLSLSQNLSVSSGDFNLDGSVDGADYLIWQRSFGNTGLN